MRIDYESEDFPVPGPFPNGVATLTATWDDLLWAAITVGRPNRYYVLRYGVSSRYELLFRASALRLAIEQESPRSWRLRRTPAARNLDPSEKGALNYFLGLTMCKLFADKLLDTPWLLHLDVFRQFLDPALLSGRSRPDLVGLTSGGGWVAMESKGRVSRPSAADRDRAKIQAGRIVSVAGAPVQWNIAGFAYFGNESLRFHWRDPKPDGEEPRNAMHLDEIGMEDFWRGYYEPILSSIGPERALEAAKRGAESIDIEEADLSIRVAPPLMKRIVDKRWTEAGNWCMRNHDELTRHEVRADGIAVQAGESWSQRQEKTEE
jgi:hypothetical protein